MTPTCEHPMRDGGCQLDADHKGRHTTQAFVCDGCSKTRRGSSTGFTKTQYGYGGEIQERFVICFFCQQEEARR